MVADADPRPMPHCFESSSGVSLDCFTDDDTLACVLASVDCSSGSTDRSSGPTAPDPVPKSRECKGRVSRLEHSRLSEGAGLMPSRSKSMLGSWATMISAEAM